jgi:hypothetical protein
VQSESSIRPRRVGLLGFEGVAALDLSGVQEAFAIADGAPWRGFFFFGGEAPAQKIPTTAQCYACHQAHGAVDSTFVQFYPTLIGVARSRQTLSAGYLHDIEGPPAAAR